MARKMDQSESLKFSTVEACWAQVSPQLKRNTSTLPTANICEKAKVWQPPKYMIMRLKESICIYIYISIYNLYHISPHWTGSFTSMSHGFWSGGSSGALRRMRIAKIGSLRFRSLPHQERSFAWIKSQGMTKFLHRWKLSKHLKTIDEGNEETQV